MLSPSQFNLVSLHHYLMGSHKHLIQSPKHMTVETVIWWRLNFYLLVEECVVFCFVFQLFLLASSKILFVNIILGVFETSGISNLRLFFVSLRFWFASRDARLAAGSPQAVWSSHHEVEGILVPCRHLNKHNKHLPASRKSFLSFFSLFVNINAKQNRLKMK